MLAWPDGNTWNDSPPDADGVPGAPSMHSRYNHRRSRAARNQPMTRPSFFAVVPAALASVVWLSARPEVQRPSATQAERTAARAPMSYLDAKPILERLATGLPADLAGRPVVELATEWDGWVSRRNG